MATSKTTKATTTERKKPIAQVRAENEKLHAEIEKLKGSAYCRMCDTIKSKDKFYMSTDPKIKGGVTPICKRCALIIAQRMDANGELHSPTKESVQEALRYLDKPFIEIVWDASIQESENMSIGKTKSNVWMSYIKNISMVNYVGMTWKDSDMFKEHIVYEDEKTVQEVVEENAGIDTYDSYIKNKQDVIRLLDYDPFSEEPVKDQPFLYSQLLGMLDASEDANEDMMRVSSAIQIVRAFLQLSKIDDAIAKLMGDIQSVTDNSATIKSLQDSKQKLTGQITSLAAENCLSLKNSKTRTKGEDTFTGRLRKIRELNLRSADLNGYDIETCKGMQQVADISMGAIIKGLRLTEDEMSDIVATQRKKIGEMDLQTKSYKEAVRILLRENLDLRDTLENKGIAKEDLVNLDDLLNTYIRPKNEVGNNE